jgi:phosphate transport system substrate-binding protein
MHPPCSYFFERKSMFKSTKRNMLTQLGVIATALVVAAGVATPAHAITLTSSGSTAIKNLLDVCIPEYQKEFSHSVSYGGGGSGAGRAALAAGTVDVAFSDGLYGASDAKPSAFTYIPATQFPLALMVKLDGFKGTLQLSPASIAGIYAGKITKWNDPAIVADNTVVNAKTKKKTVAKLPATDITVWYRLDKSGSTGIFTAWMKKLVPTVWLNNGETFNTLFPGTIPAGTFQAGSGSDGVANGVAGKDGSIGYAESSYGTERKLLLVSVQNNMGEYVQPTPTATAAFVNSFTAGDNGTIAIDYSAKVKGSYTIAGYTYAIAYTEGANKSVGTQAVVRQFVEYVIGDCANSNAARLGYAKLTGNLLALANKQILLVK